MRMLLSIIACLAAAQTSPALAQAQMLPAPREAAPRVNHYDWAQIFPVTPAFADWVRVGALQDSNGVTTGEAWLHRDSLRIVHSRSIALIEADTLALFNGRAGAAPGYVRFLLTISCGSPTISIAKAWGRVTVTDGVIRPASALTGPLPTQDNIGLARAICFDQGFRDRFLARN